MPDHSPSSCQVRESDPMEATPMPALEVPARRIELGIRCFVGLGISLRLYAYTLNYPLWWDESFVAVNFLRRDFVGLVQPLDYGQVCPLLFLWAELLVVRILGFHEWSLRLFPLICSLGSVVLFRVVAGRILAGKALLLAVAIFAVSLHPIRHAADLKPYSADLLVALIFQGMALAWLRRPDSARRLLALAAFVPFALLLSHPAIFVVGGVILALAWPAWQTRLVSVRTAWAASAISIAASFLSVYVLFTRPQASAASPGMSEMWIRSFPPLDNLFALIRWMIVAHSGDMLAYPCGGERGASTLSLIAAVAGIVALVRQGSGTTVGIWLGPLGMGLLAAALRIYPYGGPAPHGSAARIMQYAAPAFCLLIGLGGSRILDSLFRGSLRNRWVRPVCGLLVLIGLVPQIAGTLRPYRAFQAEAAREFARRFWPEVSQGAEVVCLRWDLGVAEWNSIQLGIAVSLCNQALYSPARRGHGPRMDRVTEDHPLRCVLGVAPDRQTPRLAEWLDQMSRSFVLRKHEIIRVPMTEPGRKIETESYEVFEFVPISRNRSTAQLLPQSVKGS